MKEWGIKRQLKTIEDINKIRIKLTSDLNRIPLPEEICTEMGLDLKRYYYLYGVSF